MTNDPASALADLRRRLGEWSDLQYALYVLNWDQSTYMPPGGAESRGRQMALLGRLSHEMFTDPAVGRLLDVLEPWAAGQPYEGDDAALVRVTRIKYDRATRIPAPFMAEFLEHTAHIYQAWTSARPANDFAGIRPLLEKTLDLSRRYAAFYPEAEHPADPFIAESDYGMTVATVRPLFAELRAQLAPLAARITTQRLADDSCLHRHYPSAAQLALGEKMARAYGYDFERGRQDLTHHPFATKFGPGDVRITTRIKVDDFGWGLFSTLHEAGHAMYEQGIAPELSYTTLDQGTSSGVHESQSRLWENLVGRSRAFWEHYYPETQAAFPEALGDVDLETFYRAVNRVQRSLIRTEADEVTYNLHVIIRFELECQLLEGTLAVADLPAAWNAAYAEALGVAPPDDRDGVLQDVHWYGGPIGGQFQGYTLGNVLSGQFWAAALAAHPEIPGEIAQGRFATLHGWLRDNIYRHGSKFTAAELVERVTGSPISIAPYMAYLRDKYGELYDLGE